ncbi:PadR family transcriptional regulator [Neisseriaceae bacterium JH1-16]|nr:PadR family transcriptional regulator [Neisseriaceae bacterium JH1-16]
MSSDKDLYGSLICLQIFHHVAEGPIFGLEFIENLRRHGYEMSRGMPYSMLHGQAKKGYLASRQECSGRQARHVYDITEPGRVAPAEAKTKVKELLGS